MNYFNKIFHKRFAGSSLMEILIALIISMIIFYISMDIMLKLSMNRQLLPIQKTLLYYQKDQLNIIPDNKDNQYLNITEFKYDSIVDGTMNIQKCQVYEKNGKLIFSIYGIRKANR